MGLKLVALRCPSRRCLKAFRQMLVTTETNVSYLRTWIEVSYMEEWNFLHEIPKLVRSTQNPKEESFQFQRRYQRPLANFVALLDLVHVQQKRSSADQNLQLEEIFMKEKLMEIFIVSKFACCLACLIMNVLWLTWGIFCEQLNQDLKKHKHIN